MAYDYNEYQKEYREKHLVLITVRLNKNKDKDIIGAIDHSNKNDSIKRLIRMGIGVKEA
jgi:hypothetical protein